VTKRRIHTLFSLAALTIVVAAIPSAAQTLTTLVTFNGSNGAYPRYMSLVQGLDGNFYGTTEISDVTDGAGTVFKISPSGTLTTLYTFFSCGICVGGAGPEAGLVQTADGNFYGTTVGGGANGTGSKGTVYQITPDGAVTTLYSFCSKANCADGSRPESALLLGADGNLYGTTTAGGINSTSCYSGGCGTVFKITPSGALTTLYSFCAQPNCIDGFFPAGGLIQADGSLYGTTYAGGANAVGTTFKISRRGAVTTLHNFDNTDGAFPFAGMVQASDGNFYGTTLYGTPGGYGAVFKMTPVGAVTADILDGANGAFTYSGLIQATDGNLYGTTTAGGAGTHCGNTQGCGTIFRIGPKGVLTTAYSFCVQTNCADGFSPLGGLVQGTDGNFYGTTSGNGGPIVGTVFRLSLGLGPFVKTLTTTGKVGATVIILGTNLTGSTSVTFNGTAAAFTVVSDSEITATVPSGATSGTVSVTTPGGVLNSNQEFQVKP
jgi:uncharacterized repeat protein (TIGR03803 family)